MAISQTLRLGASPAGGYDLQFVDPPDDSLQCPVCLLPFRDPHLLSCCGYKVCDPCILPIKTARRPCPICRLPVFESMLDRGYKRKVENLVVYCSKKSEGCDWKGSLCRLNVHLKNDCSYVEAECRHQCGGHYQRRLLPKHELEDCPKQSPEVIINNFEDTITRLAEGNGRVEPDFKAKLHSQIVRLKASLQTAENNHREQREKYEADISKLKQTGAHLTQNSAQREFAHAREVEQIQAVQEQQLQQQTSGHEAKIDTLTASHAQETAKLKNSLQTAEKYHQENKAKVSESKETITLLTDDRVQLELLYDQELKQTQAAHKQELQKQMLDYEAKLRTEIASHGQETVRLKGLLQTAEKSHQKDLAELDTIRRCQTQKDQDILALQRQNAELSNEIRRLENRLEQQQSRRVCTTSWQTTSRRGEQFICRYCGRVCGARIGLWSHENAHQRRGDTCRR